MNYVSTTQTRVLRQHKMKGFVEPIELNFLPKPYQNGEVELLKGRYLKLETNETEILNFKLDENVAPGFYILIS